MSFHRKRKPSSDKVEQQMTPMIDIVFQLLAFFIMTFKVVSPEGDFNISMPSAAPNLAAHTDVPLPPLKIAMKADSEGVLSTIIVNPGATEAQSFRDTRSLANFIITKYGPDTGPNALIKDMEVELACDYKLHYEHAMAAVSAVSGFVDSKGDLITLFQKVKFSRPPKRPAS
jgi:biopolymer transport protein ExbD